MIESPRDFIVVDRKSGRGNFLNSITEAQGLSHLADLFTLWKKSASSQFPISNSQFLGSEQCPSGFVIGFGIPLFAVFNTDFMQ